MPGAWPLLRFVKRRRTAEFYNNYSHLFLLIFGILATHWLPVSCDGGDCSSRGESWDFFSLLN